MNRNQMYDYLKGLGMYPMAIRHSRRAYHIEFRPNVDLNQGPFDVKTDWGYLKRCESIHLCQYGVSIKTKFEFSEIYIRYGTINEFEVMFEE